MVISVSIDNDLAEYINVLKKLKRTNNVSLIIREAFLFFLEQKYSYMFINKQNPLAIELCEQSSDIPGLTAEVIQSHLVRFPKVTPDDYRGIIEELRRRQASEEGLKNPEAAAYGLCKRIQSGHGSHDIEAKKQAHPTASETASETAETSVPEDAFAYPPQF